jgi:hypothetical protein
VDEVRAMRGLPKLPPESVVLMSAEVV